MRDPNQIDQVLEALREAWTRSPDLRLGQLLVNIAGAREPCSAIYSLEDAVLLRRLQRPLGEAPPDADPTLPQLSLLVIRVADLERSRRFYSALGLQLVREQHGGGPLHWSCDFGSMVFEIYPAKSKHKGDPEVGLGFRVVSVDEAIAAVDGLGGKTISCPQESPWGLRAVVSDPDGYRVELIEDMPKPV